MRLKMFLSAGLLIMNSSLVTALDLEKLPKLDQITGKSLLDNVNQSLAEQQIKDGQFEFKTGKAEYAPGNDNRVEGLLKVLTEHSKGLKTAFPFMLPPGAIPMPTEVRSPIRSCLSRGPIKSVRNSRLEA